MPTDNENQDTGNEPGEDANLQQVREWGNRQRARAKELSDQANQASNLARENAMLRARVDLDSPIGSMFAKAYDGELEPEAIKSAYAALGLPGSQPTEEPTDTGASHEELERQQREQQLANGGTAPGGEPAPDPIYHALATYQAAGGNATTSAQRAGLQEIFNAAAEGDPRVVNQGTLSLERLEEWQQQARERAAKARDMSHRRPAGS